jgi:tetratricopeptide (TPR) repeat protein
MEEEKSGLYGGPEGSGRLEPTVIFVLSLVLHLIYLLEVRSCPLFDYPVLDMYWHREWALEILSGDWVGREVFFRAPLYPYFLAGVMCVAGKGYFWPRLLQAMIGSLTPVLVYFVSFRVLASEDSFSVASSSGQGMNPEGLRKWAFLAGIATAFYPLFIFFNTQFLIPVLVIPLDLALVLSLLRLAGSKPGLRWAVPGVILGLSALARPTILAFAPGILIWLFFQRKGKALRPALKQAGILFFVSLSVIAPVTVRNYIAGKEFVLISSQAGINFWIGNNQKADGKSAILPESEVSYGPYRDSVWLTSEVRAESALGRQLKQSEVSGYWLREGLSFILNQPAESMILFLKKFYFLINGTEIPSNMSIYYYRNESWLLKILLFPGPLKFPFGLLLPLAGAGMFLLRARWREYLLLYLFVFIYGLCIIAFFVNARFRLPLLPFLIVFAVSGTRRWIQVFKTRQWPEALVPALIFLALLVISNTSRFRVGFENKSMPYRIMGYNYYEKKEYEKARELFIMAYELDPDSAENNNALGNIYYLEKNYRQALIYYHRAAFLNPVHSEIQNNLGLTYEAMRQNSKAERHYIEALRLWPGHQKALDNLNRVRARQGKPLLQVRQKQ